MREDPTETIPATSGPAVPPPWVVSLIFVLGVVISLAHIYFNTWLTLPNLLQNAWHFAGFSILCVLVYPAFNVGGIAPRWAAVCDLTVGILIASCALYMVAMEDAIYERGVHLSYMEWICGAVLILGAIEFTRRTTGWVIPILIVIALSYVAWWGRYVSGVFSFGGLSVETILFRSIYGDDGLFGNIARISSTFVFMFILFGAFLLRSGAGDFIIGIARAVAGRLVGGPGFVAVIASGLTGTISGSAVANTASTGVITIPLMKRAGFSGKFSAAVEAAASTGGQLMPPIMGAGAFVMASYTQIPYTTIVSVSLLPALLYFATIAFFVRVEAKKSGVVPVEEEAESLGSVLRTGGPTFLIPVSVLIGLLVSGFTPTYAAGFAIISVVIASWLTPNPMGIRAVLDALALGAKNMVMTAILLCSVGLIVNVIAMSGIGNTFSLMITEWAGNSLLLALILIALASLILGMGLPVTAAYIVLATLSAPALYKLIVHGQLLDVLTTTGVPESAKAIVMLAAPDKAEWLTQSALSLTQASSLLAELPAELNGVLQDQLLAPSVLTMALLSSHMIIFWLSQDSNVTPPVCLTAFTAAAIAKTPPMATGVQAWKVAKGLYIVPLLFAYTAMLGGDNVEVLRLFVFSLLGLYAFTCTIQGHMENTLSMQMRLLVACTAVLLLWPLAWWWHLVGAGLLIAIFVKNKARVA